MMKSKCFFALVLLPWALASQADSLKNEPMKEWTYPYAVHTLRVQDSIDVAYVDEGAGPVLVFVHGLGSNLQAWRQNIDSLRSRYRCIALDLPNYGKSSAGQYAFTMPFFADVLAAVLDQLDLHDVTLVGHSMGGQVSMHLALRSPARLRQLVLVAPAGFEQFTEAEAQWFAAVYTPAVVASASEEQIVRNFEMNFHAMPADARFMIDDRLLLRASPAYAGYCQMIPRCVLGMLAAPVWEQLPAIDLPVLVIFGAEDQLIPNRLLHPTLTTEAVARSGADRLNRAELVLVPEGGHFVQWECAAAVNKLIAEFVAR